MSGVSGDSSLRSNLQLQEGSHHLQSVSAPGEQGNIFLYFLLLKNAQEFCFIMITKFSINKLVLLITIAYVLK